MRVGKFEVDWFDIGDTATASITKHCNEVVSQKIRLSVDDIYSLEFIVKELKRKLDLK